MISAILLINQKGDVVISRFYRDDVSMQAATAFCLQVIKSKEAGAQAPVKHMDGCTFMFTRHRDMYFVAVTKRNANGAMVFKFLQEMIGIFQSYFKKNFDEGTLKENMTLIFELLDETMDFGYPQITGVEQLRDVISLGGQRTDASAIETSQLTSQITGAIDWRKEGIRYRKNEAYIDVLESVNLLMSSTGVVLRQDVTGKVQMKTYLSGMPECKFGLNDKLIMDKEAEKNSGKGGGGKQRKSVELDDCAFHRCVRLGKFDADRTITFIPPDGEFELMRYRVTTDNINLPFRVIPAIREGRNNVSINVKCRATFSSELSGTNIVVKVPVPKNTAKTTFRVGAGSAKYDPTQGAIIWRIRHFPGGTEQVFQAEVELISSIREKTWSRPPIQMEFQVPMFTSSGVHVRFLRVYDRSAYTTSRWVRYVTRAGTYNIRI